MLADDVLDDLLLPGNVGLAALVTDEGQADLIELPAAPLEDFHQALADHRRYRDLAGLLPGGKGERRLLGVGNASDDGCASLVEISCIAASPASQEGNKYPKITGPQESDAPDTVTSVMTPEPPFGTEDHLADARTVEVCGNGRTRAPCLA
jgi:hypothetical protein